MKTISKEFKEKMTRIIKAFAFINILCLSVIYGNTNPIKDLNSAIKNLQEFLSAEYMADNSALVFFNYTQEEFDEYVQANAVTEFMIEIHGMSSDGSIKNLLATDYFSPETNIENWSIEFTASEMTYNDVPYDLLYALIYVNGIDCGEGVELVPDPYEEMPDLVCGEDIVDVIDESSTEVALEIGMTYTINGFPFVVENKSEGKLSVPFGNSVVLVNLNGIRVNGEDQVIAGSLIAQAANVSNYKLDRYLKRLSDESSSNSSDICIPPPPPSGYDEDGVNTVTGLTDWGFDKDGIHESTGTTYDPHGFDTDGNHIDTSTPFNEDGCSREGLDSEGMTCELFNGVNPAAEDYLNQNATSISNTINQTLSDCTLELTGQVEAQTNACQLIRDRMLEIVGNPNNELPPELIFGANREYLDEGMSGFFTSAPVAIGEFVTRNNEVVELEQKHVDLYACDLELTRLKDALGQAGNIPADYESQINEAITQWTEYEYELYSNDTEAFEAWVKAQIEDVTSSETAVGDGNFAVQEYTEDLSQLSERDLRQKVSDIFAYKNNAFGVEQPVYLSDKKGGGDSGDIITQYQKGKKTIDGVDRIYYTRQIFDKKLKSKNEDMYNVLPLKLTNPTSDKPYDIFIERIEIGLNGARLDAVILIEDTKNGGHIVFRGENISFGTGGLSGGPDSYLKLDAEFGIRLNNAAKLHLLPEETYVSWDCNGFKAIGIAAEIEFCPEFIKGVDGGVVNETENYRLAVEASEVSNWNDFHFNITASPFVLTKYETVIWQLDNLVVDFSTSITEPTGTLPGYASPFLDGSNNLTNEWEGFYIKNLKATVPKDFTGDIAESTEVFEVAVDLAIIDDGGFSGQGSVTADLVTIEEGNLNGWAFSIDEFYLRVVNNHFAGTGFGGQIQLPIIEDPMDYKAEIYPGDRYKFAVAPITASESKLFNATLNIDNSVVVISKDESGFHTFADLTGSLAFNAGLGDGSDFGGFSFPALSFSNFQISNQSPYFSPGVWKMDGNGIGASLGGFKIELDNIRPYQPDEVNTVGLGFNLAVILNDEFDISAKGGLGIVGELLDDGAGRQKWFYKDLELHSLFVNAPIGSVAHIKGGIAFEKNDTNWGDYFQGALEVELKKLAKTTITGIAQFGEFSNEKYFYVDAMVNLPTPIPAGPISFTALGLGIYRNVSYDVSGLSVKDMLNNVNQSVFSNLPNPEASLSGGNYAFSADTDFGLKGLAQFTTASEQLMNGTVAIGTEFGDGGGLNRLYLNGAAQFLAKLNPDITAEEGMLGGQKPSIDIPMSAFVDMDMDFTSSTFTGDIAAYLNTPLLKGAGPDGSLVDGKIHFSPNQWYIKLGAPTNRAGIKFTLPGAIDIESSGYFQVGTNTDPMAGVPEEITEIAYTATRNQSLLRSGQGMVFGAKLDIDGGIGLSGIAEAKLRAIAGFDLMLRRFEGLSCEGQSGDIGINGWYAAGQLYALLEGKLKVFGIKLFEAGVAAVLQAQLPNPFFAEATVGIKAKLAFITIRKSLSISLGDACVIQADTPAAVFGADVIASIDPGHSAQDISVATQPEVHMNFPLNRAFVMPSISGGESAFKVVLQSVTMTGTSSGDIPTSDYISTDGLTVNINPLVTLPANEEITITVTVDLYENGTKFPEGQTKSVTFMTGEALEEIPQSNVKYAYPIYDMQHYHPGQSANQFLQLISGQPNLFDGVDVKMFLTSTLSSEIEVPVSYDYGNRKVNFQMPADLSAGDYRLELIQMTEGGRHIIHSINFSVSQFATFKDKLAQIQNNFTDTGLSIGYNYGEESFSTFERDNLISAEFGISSTQENNFLNQFDQFENCGACALSVNEILDGADINTIDLSRRGILIKYEQAYDRIHRGFSDAVEKCIFEYCGSNPNCTNAQLVSTDSVKKSNNNFCDISPFIGLPSGNYKVNLSYTIPGGQTSHHQLNFTK